MKIPTKDECIQILLDNNTPSNVINHCKTVAALSEKIADELIASGIEIKKDLLIAAALLHDIERVKPNHIIEADRLLKKLGLFRVAKVAKKHGLHYFDNKEHIPETIEQKILFYADKRVKASKVVSVKERIDDLKFRYGGDFSKELKIATDIENEIESMKKNNKE